MILSIYCSGELSGLKRKIKFEMMYSSNGLFLIRIVGGETYYLREVSILGEREQENRCSVYIVI